MEYNIDELSDGEYRDLCRGKKIRRWEKRKKATSWTKEEGRQYLYGWLMWFIILVAVMITIAVILHFTNDIDFENVAKNLFASGKVIEIPTNASAVDLRMTGQLLGISGEDIYIYVCTDGIKTMNMYNDVNQTDLEYYGYDIKNDNLYCLATEKKHDK